MIVNRASKSTGVMEAALRRPQGRDEVEPYHARYVGDARPELPGDVIDEVVLDQLHDGWGIEPLLADRQWIDSASIWRFGRRASSRSPTTDRAGLSPMKQR